ncbi:hypothetical protein B0H10DRAFT_2436192 [Mycena sp. CBHHK59/15]|nr:hypothetical protein B0H10DRAFT_2436192 [Mycena sp. CBHHK59/15]
MPPSPLDFQELVDHCITLLAEGDISILHRTRALVSCALVARSWVDAAQAHLFRAPHRVTADLWDSWDTRRPLLRLYRTLDTSPHLIRHVRDLNMSLTVDCITRNATFFEFCHLPFLHLESASIFLRRRLGHEFSMALQQLFSLPTLVYIKLDIWMENVSTFSDMWKRCSPTIRHLDLTTDIDLSRTPDPDLDHVQLYPWALYPFDLSHLKALSIRDDMGVPWERFHVQTVQVLDVNATTEEGVVDLSLFPNLSHLRITPIESVPPMVLETLCTITPSHHIQTIMIDLGYEVHCVEDDVDLGDETTCAPLDSKLCSLPMHLPPAVEFEVRLGSSTHEAARGFFPGLISQEMVHFVERRADTTWWEDLVHPL